MARALARLLDERGMDERLFAGSKAEGVYARVGEGARKGGEKGEELLCFGLTSERGAGKGEGEGDGEAVLPRSACSIKLLQLVLPKLEHLGDAVLVLGARGDEADRQRVAVEDVEKSVEISILFEVGCDAEGVEASVSGLLEKSTSRLTRGKALWQIEGRAPE